MQISGQKDGEVHSFNVKEFAEKMVKGRETYRMGNSPTEFIYNNPNNGKERSVNLLEVAQSVGIKNVQFKFNAEAMQKQGFMNTEHEPDNDVAYNIERIKTAKGRANYLRDKGYQDVYQDGDNYFGMKDGMMIPINNEDGLDSTDIVRFVANLGRDVGSAAGVTAAIGGGAVAAPFTGGATLAGGVAVAGVAGAAGGVIGEAAQRGVESVFGIEASKYNSEMTASEEAASAGESALIGGIGGILQPLMAFGGGKIAGLVGRKLSGSSNEFVKTAATKLEASSLSAKLPQGYMQKYASSEEAAAATEMGKAVAAKGRGDISTEGLGKVTSETEEMLASGVAKKSENEMVEDATQGALEQTWKSKELAKAENEAIRKKTAQANDEALERQISEGVEKAKVSVMDEYGGKSLQMKKAAEVMFDPDSGLDEALIAKNKMINTKLASMKKRFGMKYSEAGDGTVDGIEKASLDKFMMKEVTEIFDNADQYLGSFRHNAPTLEIVPEDGIKKTVIDSLSAEVKNMASPEDSAAVKSLITAIDGHGVNDSKVIRDAFDNFHNVVKDSESPNLSKVVESLESYEMMATKGNAAVKGFYQGQRKRVEMMDLINSADSTWDNDLVRNVVYGMQDLTRATGDLDARWTEKLIDGLHLQSVLTGNESIGLSELLTPTSRKSYQNFNFISQFDDYLGNERYKAMTATDRASKKALLYGGGVMTGLMRGSGLLESHMYGIMTAQGGVNMFTKASNSKIIKGMKSLSKKGLATSKKMGSKGLKTADKLTPLKGETFKRMGTEEYLRQKRN